MQTHVSSKISNLLHQLQMNRKIRTILTLAAFLPLPFMASATPFGGGMEKGDYLFRHNAYADAVEVYQQIKSGAPTRKDAVLDSKIADCYRMSKQPELAVVWYGKAMAAPRGVTKEMKLHYGEVLMTLQCYDDAAYWIQQYTRVTPNNHRAANMLLGCELAKNMSNAKPEGTATFLAINTDGADFAPAISDKGLVFTSNAVVVGTAKKDKWTGNFYDNIYKVTCTGDGNCNADYQEIGGKVSTKYHDGVASFTKDGRQMYFTRTIVESDMFGQNAVADQRGTVHLEIMVAEDFDATEKKYKKVTPLSFNNKDYSTIHPAISRDGNTLIFASDMPGGEGATDLYITRKDAQGNWSKPVNMGKEINTEGEEMFPVFLDDKTISFASNGLPGLGGHDVFYTSLNEHGMWSTPVNAGMPINSSYDDMSLTIGDNGLGGYFSSNRPAPKSSDNIYSYFRQSLMLDASVVDSLTGLPVNGASVSFHNGNEALDMTSNNGAVMSQLNPRAGYVVDIRMKGYHDYTATFAANQFTRVKDTAHSIFKLVPDANVAYSAAILDEASGLPIDNPLLVVTKDGSNERDTINLQTGALFNKLMESGATYRINSIKDQYYSDEKVIKTAAYGPDRIVRIADTLLMCKLSIGAICQIGDIFYDFNASDIRQDALPSLDKVLKLLHQNPSLKLQINSHTDCRGTDDYNKRLSDRRAESVIKYLASKGVDVHRLKAKGYGETMAAAKCANCEDCTEDQHQRNRRTEFLVLAM